MTCRQEKESKGLTLCKQSPDTGQLPEHFNTDQETQTENLFLKEQDLFCIVLQKLSTRIWKYDVKKQLISNMFFQSTHEPHFTGNPASIVNSDFIHLDSKKEFLGLYKKIHRGIVSASTDIKVLLKENDPVQWMRFSYTSLKNKNGQAEYAVIVGEDITLQKEAEINYQLELQTKSTISAGFIASSRVNLSKNRVEFVQTSNESNRPVPEGILYSQMAEIGAASIANEDDRKRYNTIFSRKALLKAFVRNEQIISFDYRRFTNEGKISWTNATMRLLRETVNGDIYAYGSIRDISEQKTLELMLQYRAERDSTTGAYNKETAMSMITDAVALSKKEKQPCALILFHVHNFNLIIQNYGYKLAERILPELYLAIQAEFHDPKIIGRLFSDELIVWVGSATQKNDIFNATVKLRKKVSSSQLFCGKDELSVSAGLVFSEDGDWNAEDMLDRALLTIAESRKLGSNHSIVFQADSSHEPVFATHHEQSIKSAEGTGEIILRLFKIFSGRGNTKNIFLNALKQITEYYGAQNGFVYLPEPASNKWALYEWENQKQTGKQKLSAFVIEEKLLPSLLKKNKLLHVSHTDSSIQIDSALRDKLQDNGIFSLYASKIEIDKTDGYLCICNASKSCDTAIFDALHYFISTCLKQTFLEQKHRYIAEYDPLTGVLNRDAYLKYETNHNPETLNSLGVMFLDINGLKHINNRYGNDYGDRLLCFIADTLRSLMPDDHIFRITGDEFITVSENLSEKKFFSQFEDTRKVFEENYPELILLTASWADTDITLERQIMLADEKMFISKQQHRPGFTYNKKYGSGEEEKVIADIKNDRYDIFLQPKADIAKNTISGAEALVRYRLNDDTIIAPSHFISQFEQNGIIHHIDLFMFEQVCKLLSHWRESGISPIPISLNFSRATLLTDNLVRRMNELCARYQVDKKYIEVEITESMSSIERTSLTQITAQIQQNGYRIALDDFGAQYSNLAVLSFMHMDTLKLDKTLVNDLFSNPRTEIVVRNFLTACSELHISTVAEGVETGEQLDKLFELGCEYAQGYFFNKPIPSADFEKLYLL